jgi:hypothetical protein
MADRPKLRIPETHVAPLASLARFTDAEFDALLTALEGEGLLEREDLVSRMQEALPSFAKSASDVVDLLLALDLVRETRDQEPAAFTADVEQAEGIPDEVDRPMLRSRLERALQISTLRVTAKVTDLLYSNERTHSSARIVSELRPVFSRGPGQVPSAAVLVHRLELEYFKKDEGLKSLHLILDDNDLAALEAVVARARRKTKTLVAFGEQLGLPIAIQGDIE